MHGADYLSPICQEYPRKRWRIDGLMEQTLNLSCPEAARLVLLDPDLLAAPLHASSRSRYEQFRRMSQQNRNASTPAERYFWELRGFALVLLQDRSYPLWQRLFILHLFCKRLTEVIAAKEVQLLPRLLSDYAEIIEEGKLHPAMDGISIEIKAQVAAVLEVIVCHIEHTHPTNTRIRECVKDFREAIQYQDGVPVETFVPYYEEAHSRYYAPFMQAHPYVLENYLINHIFKTRFPFPPSTKSEPMDATAQSLVMCLQYSIIKGLLIGMAGCYKEAFGPEHIVKLVSSFAKAVEHCPAFPERLNRELGTTEGMVHLLKN